MYRYKHLTLQEREEVSRGLACGVSLRRIARKLGRSASTVAREVCRNSYLGRWHYRAATAHVRARRRACQPRRREKLRTNPRLWSYVVRRLQCKWSPAQISHRLRREYPANELMRVSHETIYRTLHRYKKPKTRKHLLSLLRRGYRKKRREQGHVEYRGKVPGMVSIHQRPAIIESRSEVGHWEGDLLLGRGKNAFVGTLVERATRYTRLVRIEEATSVATRAGFESTLRGVPRRLRQTLTYDRGREMARHHELSRALHIRVYFADAGCPWQRGTCENTNGLLRQYLPKKVSMDDVTQGRLNAIARELNNRPRKSLGWSTPNEVFQLALKCRT